MAFGSSTTATIFTAPLAVLAGACVELEHAPEALRSGPRAAFFGGGLVSITVAAGQPPPPRPAYWRMQPPALVRHDRQSGTCHEQSLPKRDRGQYLYEQ